MRYRQFKYSGLKLALNEARTMSVADYYNDSDPKRGKYIKDLRKAIKSKGKQPVTIFSKKEQYTVTFTNPKDVAKKLDAIVQDFSSGNKPDWKLYKIQGLTSDGKKVTFQFNNISKYLPSSDANKENPGSALNVNAGNVTEGIIGLAMATKFSNTSKVIEMGDVLSVGKQFIESGKKDISIGVTDRTNDKLNLKITLPKNDTTALSKLISYDGDGKKVAKELGLSDKAAVKLNSLLNKAVSYANTGEAPKQAITKIQEYYKDGITQEINVVSDGAEAENQSMTKVDLRLIVKGKTTDVLSLLSVKAGSGRSQLGQSSGKPFSNLRLFWKQNFNYNLPSSYKQEWDKLYKKLGDEKGKIPNTFETSKAIINGPIRATYDWAASQIKRHLSGDRQEGEISFLEHLQQGLLYHSGKNIDPKNRKATATKGDDRVVVTIIDFGKTNDFVELRFANSFYNLMTYFDLESSGVINAEGKDGGTSGVMIQVIVKPDPAKLNNPNTPEAVKNIAKQLGTGKLLVQYRSYIQDKTTIRNIVEIDKGAKILGALSNEQFKIAKAMNDPEKNDTDQIKSKTITKPTPAPAPAPPQNKTAVQPQGTI